LLLNIEELERRRQAAVIVSKASFGIAAGRPQASAPPERAGEAQEQDPPYRGARRRAVGEGGEEARKDLEEERRRCFSGFVAMAGERRPHRGQRSCHQAQSSG
jgi:hypothetical protein